MSASPLRKVVDAAVTAITACSTWLCSRGSASSSGFRIFFARSGIAISHGHRGARVRSLSSKEDTKAAPQLHATR
eukprot:2585489-Prymnesium_polylepis.1